MSKVNPVVTVKWVADMLASKAHNFRVLDATWHLPSTHRHGRAEFASEHIPEAKFFDIDVCADQEAKHLSHMLPKAADFEEYVGKLGINNDTHVVIYDNNDRLPLFSAQRVWWTFRVFGHEKVSVMEGGLRKWKNQNNFVKERVIQVPKETFTARFNPKLVKSFEEIEANQFKEKEFTLIDARPQQRFEGRGAEPRPGIKPGCIPGSVNLPFTLLMDESKQTLKTKEELQQLFDDLPVDLTKPVAATCGSGVSACMVALAAYVCGKEDMAVYDGSWVEWYQRARPDQMDNVPQD